MLATRMIEAAAHFAPGQSLFSDNFDRADSATTLGAAWTPATGTWGIASNLAYDVNHTDGQVVLTTSAMAVANYTVTAKIPTVSSGESPGIIARATDATHCYLLHVQSGGSTLALFVVNPGFTGIYTSPSGNFAPGDTIGIQCLGSAISVLHNGGTLTTITDATFAGPGKVGLRYGMSGATTFTARWDNFKVVTA